MTWNDLQQVRHNLQWTKPTYNKQRKDAKRSTTSRFWDYFTVWGNWFSSLTRFQFSKHLVAITWALLHGESWWKYSAKLFYIIMCFYYGIRCEPLWHSYINICQAKVNLMNQTKKVKFWHRENIHRFESDYLVVFSPSHWQTTKYWLYFVFQIELKGFQICWDRNLLLSSRNIAGQWSQSVSYT